VKQVATLGRVADGKLLVSKRREFDAELARWQDCRVSIVVERLHATRSKAQNDYYWSVVVARIAGTWAVKLRRKVSPHEVHDVLKAQFLPHDDAAKGVNGTLINGLVIGGTTTKLNKLQFVEYLEAIVAWAAEKWDVYIQDPDPLWRQHAESEVV
jgi:hypothetical protein